MSILPASRVPPACFGACLLALGLAASVAAQTSTAPIVRDVRGTVRGAGDEKVRVTLWHNDMVRGSLDPVAEGFAAADGSFEFRAVAWFEKQQWGSHKFVVVGRTSKRVGVLEIRGDEAAVDQLRVELLDAIDLHGVLRAKDTGKPIAGAWVWPFILGWRQQGGAAVWLTAPLLPWRATTDAEGRFTLKGLPPIGPMKLLAASDEFARTNIDVDDLQKLVEAELPLGGRVRGTVTMPDGKPAARVLVRTTSSGAGYGETMTSDDGTFCLSALEAGVYKVWAEVDDLTVVAVVDLDVAAGAVIENQRVQLVKGGFIVGRIVDKATGKAIAPGPHTDVAMYGPARGSGGSCEVTPVLADGTFRIRAPAGRNQIYLRAAEGWSEPSEFVEVVEGQETKVQWQLVRAGPRLKDKDVR